MWAMGCLSNNFFISTIIIFASAVDKVLLIRLLEVVMCAVDMAVSPL
jgi:hypothetical protein